MSTILATYSSPANASIAVEALKTAGVPATEIGVLTLDNAAGGTGQVVASTAAAPAGEAAGKAAGDAASGAATGGLLGAVGGLLVGVAALAIPGLGALLVAGPIAAALGLTGVAATAATGAGIGIAAGGTISLVKSLMNSGLTETDANLVQSNLQTGGVVVSVKEHAGINVNACLQAGNPVKIATMAGTSTAAGTVPTAGRVM